MSNFYGIEEVNGLCQQTSVSGSPYKGICKLCKQSDTTDTVTPNAGTCASQGYSVKQRSYDEKVGYSTCTVAEPCLYL